MPAPVRSALRRLLRALTPARTTPRRAPGPGAAAHGTYAGDFTGRVRPVYAPRPDGRADPGEVVWTWVPYEEDTSRGKDRPVLVVGRDGAHVLGLMLTSKDHARPGTLEVRGTRAWLDVGAGPWDRLGRPSEIRLDRVLRLDPAGIRREGAVMDRTLFDQVTSSLARVHNW